jgi:hypothetical protein
MTSELEELRRALDGMRASVLRKLTGLSDADARRSTVPSGTNLAGLVQHLTYVESLWFEEIVSGRSARRGKRSMQVDQAISVATLRSEYRTACAASNAIISSIGDADAPVTRAGKTSDFDGRSSACWRKPPGMPAARTSFGNRSTVARADNDRGAPGRRTA